MQIIEIKDKKQLNDFVSSQPMSQFLQSWQWGIFHGKVDSQVWRIGVSDDNLPAQAGKLLASAQINSKKLPMGKNYLYCGRGPIALPGSGKKEAIRLIFKEIARIAEQAGAMFLRFDPIHKLPGDDYKIKGDETLIKTLDVQPSKTAVLDLTKTAEEILKAMHQKTRYNINLAEKKGVKIVEADQARFEEFWSLLDQTSGRDKFRPHGRSYYQAMIEPYGDNPVKLFFAEYKGKAIATALVCFFSDTATYIHGGSSNEERNVMAPYLLQWHAIKMAKANGQKYYDFHGIDEVKWPGVTRFKLGFGGTAVNYPGTFDLIYDSGWYNIYKMVRKVRRTF